MLDSVAFDGICSVDEWCFQLALGLHQDPPTAMHGLMRQQAEDSRGRMGGIQLRAPIVTIPFGVSVKHSGDRHESHVYKVVGNKVEFFWKLESFPSSLPGTCACMM